MYYPSDATLEMQNMTKPGSTLAAGFNPRCSLTSRRVLQTRVCGRVRSVEVNSSQEFSGARARQSSPVRVLGVVSRCRSGNERRDEQQLPMLCKCRTSFPWPGVVAGGGLGSYVDSFVVSSPFKVARPSWRPLLSQMLL